MRGRAIACGCMLLGLSADLMRAQSTPPPPAAPQAQPSAPEARPTRARDTRSAARLYVEASKLFMDGRFEEALGNYDEAAGLDPANTTYRLAAEVARNHAVTALIQAAAKARMRGDAEGARAALARALKLDPKSIEASQHLYELGDDVARATPTSLYSQEAGDIGGAVQLEPAAELHSFHMRNGQRQVIQQVFRAFGIDTTADDSVQSTPTRFDIDDASFEQAARALSMSTNTFYVPIDAHRALVARDTPANRLEFTRQEMETIYLSGLKAEELTEVSNLAKQVFNLQHVQIVPSKSSITIRAPRRNLDAFNTTIRELVDGHSQVMLDVRLIQIAHSSGHNTGITPPQTFTAFNVYAEEQSILSANQDLVQQIISSGLAAPGDTLAIIAILLASGQVSSSLFSNGLALFGGGITQSALAPGSATANFNLNSSDSKQLDQIRLHLGDGEPGTIKQGERYPIQTSSFSSLSAAGSNIPGLSGAGSSADLSSILASLGGGVPSVPQVEYQDLGLTLKTTANVMRNGDVALTVDMQISALAGGSINGNPILTNRAYSGVVTIPEGQGVVVASELDQSESRYISGTPGLSEIPGLNNITDKNVAKNYATLLIVITPHVIRGTQASGHSPMMRVESGTTAR